MLQGRAAVVLGNSPALGAVDCALLDQVVTIGVNRVCRLVQPDILLVVDRRILRDEEADLRSFPATPATTSGSSA